ncbi:hypothetical protein BGZ95_001783 [Linnemannia exigua]|uniref:Uncharacterized protein n=1 Tax=Linnemannia exigua TaxID=604196 RepID=A0AAD4H2H8_9FUNG|nr:hypothetical protein BGZ95_001783 [Linnemannia exigua]
MLGTSTARIRQILTLVCLACIFLCSLVIMGLVGVNGNVTFRNLDKGCLLYMTADGDATTYNNGFCLFPIVAAAVTAVISLVFLIILVMVLNRRDEFSPRAWSIAVLFLSGLLALLSFAMCGEIGLGLNKGCRLLEEKIDSCRSTKNFNALFGAQITSGIMGGFWLLTMILEVFQLKGRPTLLSANTVDIAGQTTVVPSRKNKNGISTSNISNPNLVSTSSSSTTHLTSTSTPAPTPAPAQAHIDHYNQHPEMTAYHAQNSQVQQQYYHQTPQLYAQQVQTTPQLQYQQVQQTPQLQYQQDQQNPQFQYNQDQHTPQLQHQQVPQQQAVYQQQPPILQSQPLPPHQQIYQPHQQQQAPLQLQQPYPAHPTPVAHLYPEDVSVDTLPTTTTTTTTISSTSNNVH